MIVPGSAFIPYFVPPAGGGVSGNGSVLEFADIATGQGRKGHVGTGAVTEAGDIAIGEGPLGWIPWFDPDHMIPHIGQWGDIAWDATNQWWRIQCWLNGPGFSDEWLEFKNLGVLDGLGTGIRITFYEDPPGGGPIHAYYFYDVAWPPGATNKSNLIEGSDIGAGPSIEGYSTRQYLIQQLPLIRDQGDTPQHIFNAYSISCKSFSIANGGLAWITNIEIYIP